MFVSSLKNSNWNLRKIDIKVQSYSFINFKNSLRVSILKQS
jgi:hypothetical protein